MAKPAISMGDNHCLWKTSKFRPIHSSKTAMSHTRNSADFHAPTIDLGHETNKQTSYTSIGGASFRRLGSSEFS
ncbi:hypothetical protein S245_006929 [Arachis hypogaea]